MDLYLIRLKVANTTTYAPLGTALNAALESRTAAKGCYKPT